MPNGAAATGVLAPEEGAVERPVQAAPPIRRPAPSAAAGVARRAAPSPVRRSFAESVADYRYVTGDLRRIAMLAGGLVVLLIILSFVIH